MNRKKEKKKACLLPTFLSPSPPTPFNCSFTHGNGRPNYVEASRARTERIISVFGTKVLPINHPALNSIFNLDGWLTEIVRIILPKSGLGLIIVDTLSFSGQQHRRFPSFSSLTISPHPSITELIFHHTSCLL